MCDVMDAEPANSFHSMSRARCFAHIINLTAHTLIAPFDAAAKRVAIIHKSEIPTASPDDYNTEPPTDSTPVSHGGPEEGYSTPDIESVNSSEVGLENWIDDFDTMSEAELNAFVADTAPLRKVLVKVCRCFHLVYHMPSIWR
jgi:hypothetical protein